MQELSDIIGSRFKTWCHFLKESLNTRESILNSLTISDDLEGVIGYLLPISKCHLADNDLINKMAKWRNENQFAYPTRFTATQESTKLWLENQVLNNPNRMLFWVADSYMKIIGHLGVILKPDKKSFEVDNVLRGESGSRGLMRQAMKTLELEIEKEFSIESLTLRVLSSNTHAIDFYSKLEYVELERESLRKVESENQINLVPGTPVDDYFVTMEKSLTNIRPIPTKILTAGPSISTLESALVFDATVNGWNSRHSDYISLFEAEFAEMVGAKFAMATSSCTGALHLALLALDIGPGDEVIVPEVTWVATASAVRYVGATPVFADIDPIDWTISIRSIEELITPRTKALVPVHLYGFGAYMPGVMELAKKHGLFVVEDAAPAIGTLINGKAAGSFGDFGCFSFQGAKLLVTGEGGMLVTNDESLYAKAKKIQDHGRKPGTFWIEELGHKYKMNNITAALGLGQIRRSANQIYRKRRINDWYKSYLSNVPGLSFQEERKDSRSICWMTSICIHPDLGISRDLVMRKLAEANIDSRPTFPAISQYEFWPTKSQPKPVGKFVGDNAINLPSGVMLSKASIERISLKLREIFKAE